MKAALRAGLCAVVATALLGTAAAKVAPFREGDRVMFLGDSITHGGWYVAYLQYIWCLRNPGKRITLLNGGICGNTAAEGLSRFDWDIAPEKPNRVFIMFGMNDVGHGAFWDPASTAEKDLATRREKVEAYRANMKALVAKCRAIGGEVTLVTPTPYDEYSPLIEKAATKGVNDPGLRSIADATRALAAEEKLECVDLYGPLTPILRDHPEVKFLADRVHPHDDGHLLMAALVLDAMDFPATVDGATFDASKGDRRFTYSPKALPFPVNNHYRSDDRMYPLTEKFNREIIRVTGLPAGWYALKAAGRTLGRYSAADLDRGVNVATLDTPSQRRAGEGVGKVAAPLKKLAGNLRGLPQGYVQVTKRGGDINDQASCFAKLDEWIEELRKANAADGHYYRYYGGEVKAFKELYPKRDAEKARLEKLREDIFDWCRPEPFEISVEPAGFCCEKRDASEFGFSPEASGVENAAALQKALDEGGTVTVRRPGDYKIASTVLIGDDTTLDCGAGVRFVKSLEGKKFSHVILNRGALTKTWNRNIVIRGLEIVVNGMDWCDWKVFGLRGQLAFFYVKDLRIERFRCLDLGRGQYCIHVCTFEDVIVDDVRIFGWKDGVHFGRGRRFTVRNGVFDTGDDPIALNAHDYSSGNPELGWIEDGVIENCHDLENPSRRVGFFCRILAGAWCDWREGMEVQQGDSVVSEGRLYRVSMPVDGKTYVSKTRPTHRKGQVKLDGINWVWVQDEAIYACGVRNVTFRDCFLHQPRPAFSVHYDFGKWSRSQYPGAKPPRQEGLVFDNVNVLHDGTASFISVATPVDSLTVTGCTLRNGGISFHSNPAMAEYGYGDTRILMNGCRFYGKGAWKLLHSSVKDKNIELVTSGSMTYDPAFKATVMGESRVKVTSDLPGLAD